MLSQYLKNYAIAEYNLLQGAFVSRLNSMYEPVTYYHHSVAAFLGK